MEGNLYEWMDESWSKFMRACVSCIHSLILKYLSVCPSVCLSVRLSVCLFIKSARII